jgi:16S rRNA (uracil1498-N3)-methyltransferase
MAELRGDAARHLTRVLRAQPGQQYEISDNQAAYLAELTETHPERAVFRILERIEVPEPPVRVTLCAALIKFDRFEWIVEKATELGVECILPVETARVEKGLLEASRKRTERWERIARESSQQSASLARALATPADYRYFLEESGAPSFPRMLPPSRKESGTAALLVGPEGGWTDAERQAAADAGWLAVGLGPQILRAETAALAALAILLTAWMA